VGAGGLFPSFCSAQGNPEARRTFSFSPFPAAGEEAALIGRGVMQQSFPSFVFGALRAWAWPAFFFLGARTSALFPLHRSRRRRPPSLFPLVGDGQRRRGPGPSSAVIESGKRESPSFPCFLAETADRVTEKMCGASPPFPPSLRVLPTAAGGADRVSTSTNRLRRRVERAISPFPPFFSPSHASGSRSRKRDHRKKVSRENISPLLPFPSGTDTQQKT